MSIGIWSTYNLQGTPSRHSAQHAQAQDQNRRAVLYARVSTIDQERGFSPDAQFRLLREYAAKHDLEIIKEFKDAESAGTTGRTGFTAMLSLLRKEKEQCRIVLVEKHDRLYRNKEDDVTMEQLGVEIHFVKENTILSHDSHSSEKLIHGIKVVLASHYLDNLKEEVKKGLREKAQQGYWPSYAPFGYKNIISPNEKHIIVPDPVFAPMVTALFEWYSTGQYSLRTLAKKAREAGFHFRKTTHHLPTTTIHNILSKRVYTGQFDFARQTYQGTHEPLVSTPTWERVQELLSKRGREKEKARTKHDFAYTGMIQCAHCGCHVTAEQKTKTTKREKRVHTWIYYHCTGYKGNCKEPYTRQEVLAEQLANALQEIIVPPPVIAWLQETITNKAASQAAAHQATKARLQADLDRLEHRLEGLYVDKLDGNITREYCEEKSAAWRNEQDQVRQQLALLETQDGDEQLRALNLLATLSKAAALFRQQTALEQRRLLTIVLASAVLAHGRLQIRLRPAFEALRVSNPVGSNEMTRLRSTEHDFDNWRGSSLYNPGYSRVSVPYCSRIWSKVRSTFRTLIYAIAHLLVKSVAAFWRSGLC